MFYRKNTSKEKCTFIRVETNALVAYFNDSRPVTYILGETPVSPTGEPYVKIFVEGDDPEEAEGALLFLLDQYRKKSTRQGKKYLYWRVPPILSFNPANDNKWYGRARLLYTKKIPEFMKANMLKGGKTAMSKEWACTFKQKKVENYK